MNKVTYFRRQVAAFYQENQLAEAANAGEALLREHAGSQTGAGMAYADDLYNLARIYDDLGVVERAASLYVASARLVYERSEESLDFARRLNGLAALLGKWGHGEMSYLLFSHAVDILKENEGAQSVEMADGLYNLANAAAETGRRGEALRLHRKALNIREKAGAAGDVINSLHSLAFLYEDRKDRTHAFRYAETARARAKGTDAYLSACYYLAELYDADGQKEKALPLYAESLRQIAAANGSRHSTYITAASRLAGVLADMKEYRRALSLWRVICGAFKERPEGRQLFYASGLRGMAVLHRLLNEPEKAAACILESIRIKLRIMGEHAKDIPADTVFLMEVYLNNDQLEKALETLVFTLTRVGKGQAESEKVLDALTELYARAGHNQFSLILKEMEKLNNPARLWEIVRKWADWAARDE